MELPTLVQCFMDVNLRQEVFPCMISETTTLILSTWWQYEKFILFDIAKQTADQWAIVDVSIDKGENNIDARICSRRPSGYIIEAKWNGHNSLVMVIWVEHMESQRNIVQTMYHTIVNSGIDFCPSHWITLQLLRESLVFFMATNVPTKDSSSTATLEGRKSILKLAQRMTKSFY
ncbi:hypothetical protein POM88_039233 [Heracleum sosnowskyi]|uniref:START domain-containing protein n=1 Tax=Heracleum sosnowskyi TaxID=360622 RepID=A0AAD8HCR2_9APIA|nr:hypothetical protein POM88_039233 [Heracleum sosnowskyi]